VVYHDGRAGRGGSLVAHLGYQELCDRLGYVVPRVDEVMALLAGRLIGHLDLKEIGYEPEAVALASSTLGPGNFVVTTLEDASVATIKRAFPGVRTALSLGRSLRECHAAGGRGCGAANCFRSPGSGPAALTGWRSTTGSRVWAWPGRAT
jgi:glycerophosphoryl diester phosphodiesterase